MNLISDLTRFLIGGPMRVKKNKVELAIFAITLIATTCLCLVSALPALLAQGKAADPISGIWFGYYGTSPRDQAQVRLTLEWDGKVLTGNVTTGDDPFDIEKATFDPKTG